MPKTVPTGRLASMFLLPSIGSKTATYYPSLIMFSYPMTSAQLRGNGSSSEATAQMPLLLQNARNINVLHSTSSCCCTSPWTLTSANSPVDGSIAAPYRSSVCARWTILLICLHASLTASNVRSRLRIVGDFQHSTSRKRWNVRKSFFLVADRGFLAIGSIG